eukprot:9593132-Alexandrium_andersonii.AAC.1
MPDPRGPRGKGENRGPQERDLGYPRGRFSGQKARRRALERGAERRAALKAAQGAETRQDAAAPDRAILGTAAA